MEGIANDLYVQFGALGLLAASGWVVAWRLYIALGKIRDKYEALVEKALKTIDDNTSLYAVVADRLARGD